MSLGSQPPVQSRRNLATDPAIARQRRPRSGYRRRYKPVYGGSRIRQRAAYIPRVDPVKQELAIKVPDCTIDYLDALCNPFETPAGVCLPADIFPMPSQKVKAFSRGTFTLGTSGVGFIIMSPSTASDTSALAFSTATTVMTTGTTIAAATNKGYSTFAKLPYTYADVVTNSEVQCRLVGAGVRVRYVGTENGRNGSCIAYEDADHSSIEEYTWLTMLQENSVKGSRPSGDGSWDASVSYTGPVRPSDLSFVNDDTPAGTTNASVMGIMVSGVAGDQYAFEAVVHVEYIGSKVPGKTKTHADAQTYAQALATVKEAAAVSTVVPQDRSSVFESFFKRVGESLPQLIPAGVSLVKGLVTKNPADFAIAGGHIGSLVMGSNEQSQAYRPALTDRQRYIMAP